MAYCELDEVKDYKDILATAEDSLLEPLIVRAQQMIDNHCGRTFEASADTTRKFDAVRDVQGDILYFDEDICSITTVTNNADGGINAEVVTKYVTLPRNITPYHAIRLLYTANTYWTYTDDPENGITVVGKWAYSLTAPADIKHACIRLVAYLFAQKDAQVFDVTADAVTGMLTIPQGLPTDVKRILDMYRKIV